MTPERAGFSLLSDDALLLEADPGALAAVDRWLPRSARRIETAPDRPAARIRVAVTAEGPPSSDEPPAEPGAEAFRLGSVTGRRAGPDAPIELRADDARATGHLDLDARLARLEVPAGPGGAPPSDQARAAAYSMLTIASGLLLGRLDAALVHGGAVVGPGGGAWLVLGDARAGKSTLCATLIRGGLDWLSDDQVVLRAERRSAAPGPDADAPAPPVVAGWPRTFHLDRGWPDGEPTGERVGVDPGEVGPGAWTAEAPLAGLLLPAVEPDAPTHIEPATPADALEALVRQSPWLMADRRAARTILGLLETAVREAGFVRRVRMGRDSFGAPDVLLEALPSGHGAAPAGGQLPDEG